LRSIRIVSCNRLPGQPIFALTLAKAELLVLDATMTVGVELVEVDLTAAGAGSAVGLDGNANETELQVTFPTGTWGHGKKTPLSPPCGIVP
jgi:hypothetical protein